MQEPYIDIVLSKFTYLTINTVSCLGKGSYASIYTESDKADTVIRIEQMPKDEYPYIHRTLENYNNMMRIMPNHIKQYFCTIEDIYSSDTLSLITPSYFSYMTASKQAIGTRHILKNALIIKYKKYDNTLCYYNLRGLLTIDQKIILYKQLMEVIEWTSMNKIVINDISSRNIMIVIDNDKPTIKIIDYLITYSDDAPVLINTYPAPEHLFAYNDKIYADLNSIPDYTWTYNLVGLGMIAIELFTVKSFYGRYSSLVVGNSNNQYGNVIRYCLIFFLMDSTDINQKLNAYDFKKWDIIFRNIMSIDDIKDIYAKHYSTFDKQTIEILRKTNNYLNNFNSNTYNCVLHTKKYPLLNTTLFALFLSKLFKFNHKERTIDFILFNSMFCN